MTNQARTATVCDEQPISTDRPWVIVAANPYSGSGPSRKLVSELVMALAEAGIGSRVIWSAVDRANLLRDVGSLAGCRCVIAAGGDGTVADVINEMPRDLPFATLPIGNENLFAREFGFRSSGEWLARAIAAGRTRRVDLGWSGNRLFSLMLSVGFDAAVVHLVARWRAARSRLRRVNRFSYAKPIVTALRSYRYEPIELESDGVRVRGTHAFVFNLPQYGFQLPFVPGALPDDGLIDWVVFERPGFGSALGYLMSVVRGTHTRRADVYHGRGRRLSITSAVSMPVQVDGDPAGFTPVEVETLPGALTVLVGKRAHWAGPICEKQGF